MTDLRSDEKRTLQLQSCLAFVSLHKEPHLISSIKMLVRVWAVNSVQRYPLWFTSNKSKEVINLFHKNPNVTLAALTENIRSALYLLSKDFERKVVSDVVRHQQSSGA